MNSLNIIEEFTNKINTIPGDLGEKIKIKLGKVLCNNSGYEIMKNIAKIHSGQITSLDIDPHTIACFKYAPITSTEVERSFSIYKNLLNDKRQNFTFENLRMHLVIMCNREM